MHKKKKIRFRFSLKALIVFVTIFAGGLGGWISYSKYKIQKLVELREQGAIVILRDGTPQFLQSLGIKNLSPLFDVPTVELYITPAGNDALVGNCDRLLSCSKAEELLLETATIARSYGVEDIHLCINSDFNQNVSSVHIKWARFAIDNTLRCFYFRDSKKGYLERLGANQEF